ncbi:MAG: mechanosensitive ion channel domain-containing protein, partial [Sphingomonas sp.]
MTSTHPGVTAGAALVLGGGAMAALLGVGPGLVERHLVPLLGAGASDAAVETLFVVAIFGTIAALAILGGTLSGVRTLAAGGAPARNAGIGGAIGLGGIGIAISYAAIAGVVRSGEGGGAVLALFAGALVVLLQVAAEELYFRGWLQPVVARAWGKGAAIGLVSVLFALLHLLGGALSPVSLINLVLGGVLFAVFVMLGKWVHRVGMRVAHRVTRRGNLGLILGNLFQWLFVGLGLLIALSIIVPSFQARNLIELLGIGTVAIGFAFRDILQNFFAGILILITEPFEIGDTIIVDKFEGTVQTIETRATTILSLEGRRIVIPNTTLFTQAVVVTSADEKLRTTYDVELPRGDDLEAARAQVIAA